MPCTIKPDAMDEEFFAVGFVDALNPEQLLAIGIAVTPLSGSTRQRRRRRISWRLLWDAMRLCCG
jgi:hypothetical protein